MGHWRKVDEAFKQLEDATDKDDILQAISNLKQAERMARHETEDNPSPGKQRHAKGD